MKAQEVNAMFVKALGYTVEWNDVNAKAEELEVAITAADDNSVLRGEAFAALRATLDVPKMDGTDTLGTVLALPNYVSPVAPTPEVVEVVSIKALNLKQIEVVYNSEIEDAGDEGNYSDDASTALINANADFELQEDNMTVIITLETAADQQDVVEVTVEDIAEDDTTIEIEFLDLTIPTVDSAEAVGNDTIKVFFSEPMENGLTTKANYAVEDADGDTLYVKNVTSPAGSNAMYALVELYSDLEGDVTITVSDVKDFNEFTALDTELDVVVTVDEEGPVVVDYKDATPTGVTLILNEDVESAETLADFYHTNTSNIAATVSVSGNEIELTFASGDEMPVGTAYIYVAEEAINDLWDNDNDKLTFAVEVIVDETAPAVDGEVDVTGQDTVEITFTEDVVEGDDFAVTLLDEDGEEVDNAATVTITDEVMKLDFADALYGDFSVVLEDLEDEAGNTMDDTTLTFTVDDETQPTEADFTGTIYNAGTADQLVVINFDQDMDADAIATKTMYWFGAENFDDDDVTITLIDEGVEIAAPAADVFVLAAGDVITVGRLADEAGNLLDTLTADVTLTNGSVDLAAPDVELTAPDTVVVTAVDELTSIDTTKYSFDAGVTIAKVKTTTNSDGNTEIVFTLGADVNTDATSGGAITLTVAGDAGSNVYGQDMPAAGYVVADACAPEVDEITFVNATTIEITFTEDLESDYFTTLGTDGFSVTGGDAELTKAVLAADGNVVTLTGTDFTVDTNVFFDDVYTVNDMDDNSLEAFDYTDELEQ